MWEGAASRMGELRQTQSNGVQMSQDSSLVYAGSGARRFICDTDGVTAGSLYIVLDGARTMAELRGRICGVCREPYYLPSVGLVHGVAGLPALPAAPLHARAVLPAASRTCRALVCVHARLQGNTLTSMALACFLRTLRRGHQGRTGRGPGPPTCAGAHQRAVARGGRHAIVLGQQLEQCNHCR